MLNIICHIQNTQVNQEQSPTYIQFANVLEVLVQGLHHVVDELEQGQLVQVAVNIQPDDEVKRGVPPVDHLILPMLQKRTLWPHKQAFQIDTSKATSILPLTWFSVRDKHLRINSPSSVIRSCTEKLL